MDISVKLVMAQVNLKVGAITANTQLILKTVQSAQLDGAQVVVFPELTICGYPPEDLLLRADFIEQIASAVDQLRQLLPPRLYVIIGYPKRVDGALYNMVGVFYNGKIIAEYAKQHLPNYQVFDEERYFTDGTQTCIVELAGVKAALSICEDIWIPATIAAAKHAGAELVISLNASPFHGDKVYERIELLKRHCTQYALPMIYVNCVGGQDELVFDGGSLAVSPTGMKVQAPLFEAALQSVMVTKTAAGVDFLQANHVVYPSTITQMYEALVLGVRDYFQKNNIFNGVILGLSGGIDSALTLAIAVDALGADKVTAVMMPFRYTADISQIDAKQQADALGVQYEVISIEPLYESFMASLNPLFAGAKLDSAEENLQARCRGVLLMALSNKRNLLVLTTSNKSEVAVGYSTLYGDMAGGFNVLKDVFKTKVYQLANFYNAVKGREIIPQRVIDRPPSAELRADQTDQDSLPDYDTLDAILAEYIEQDAGRDAIIAKGFSRDAVEQAIKLVRQNEYKRRQSPIGPRLTKRGFGRDRRYPVTSGL